jgi:hypothetical protein
MTPNFSRASQMTARSQTKINQTLIVCALECYHLAHGQYPDTLLAWLQGVTSKTLPYFSNYFLAKTCGFGLMLEIAIFPVIRPSRDFWQPKF